MITNKQIKELKQGNMIWDTNSSKVLSYKIHEIDSNGEIWIESKDGTEFKVLSRKKVHKMYLTKDEAVDEAIRILKAEILINKLEILNLESFKAKNSEEDYEEDEEDDYEEESENKNVKVINLNGADIDPTILMEIIRGLAGNHED